MQSELCYEMCVLVAMEGLETYPFSAGLPHTEAAVSRATEQMAGGPLEVRRMEGKGRDSPVSRAHQEAQVHVCLQAKHCSTLHIVRIQAQNIRKQQCMAYNSF